MRPLFWLTVASLFILALFTNRVARAEALWAGKKAKGTFVGRVHSQAALGEDGLIDSSRSTKQIQRIRRNGDNLTVATQTLNWLGRAKDRPEAQVGKIVESFVDRDGSTLLKVRFDGERNRKLSQASLSRSLGKQAGHVGVKSVKGESIFRFGRDGTVSFSGETAVERGPNQALDGYGFARRFSEVSEGHMKPAGR